MSYCRWSSEDFQCDVYVYADVSGGWTTHVARYRYIFKQPLPPDVSIEDIDAWLKRDQKIGELLRETGTTKIEHPEAGKSHNDPDPGSCAQRLIKLKAEGFQVPQYAIDALLEEQKEMDANEPSNS